MDIMKRVVDGLTPQDFHACLYTCATKRPFLDAMSEKMLRI